MANDAFADRMPSAHGHANKPVLDATTESFTTALKAAYDVAPPLRFGKLGAIALGVFAQDVADRAMTVATVVASLGTASTTGAVTVTVKKNGTLVLTLTFAVTATAPTLLWAVGSSFAVVSGDVLEYEVTAAGTGAASLRGALRS